MFYIGCPLITHISLGHYQVLCRFFRSTQGRPTATKPWNRKGNWIRDCTLHHADHRFALHEPVLLSCSRDRCPPPRGANNCDILPVFTFHCSRTIGTTEREDRESHLNRCITYRFLRWVSRCDHTFRIVARDLTIDFVGSSTCLGRLRYKWPSASSCCY